jgi:hypothetical protein
MSFQNRAGGFAAPVSFSRGYVLQSLQGSDRRAQNIQLLSQLRQHFACIHVG